MAPDRIIHMNGRVYDPKLGRMLSPDPVTQAPENGQNYNRYSYVSNNPLKYTDPNGFQKKDIKCADGCYTGAAVGVGLAMGEVLVTGSRSSSGIVGNPAALLGGGGSSSPMGMAGDKTDGGRIPVTEVEPVDEDACQAAGNACNVQYSYGETVLTLSQNFGSSGNSLGSAALVFGSAGAVLDAFGGSAGITSSGSFRWYTNGWHGNQYIRPIQLTAVAGPLAVASVVVGIGSDVSSLLTGDISPGQAALNTGASLLSLHPSPLGVAAMTYLIMKDYGAAIGGGAIELLISGQERGFD